MTPRHLLTTADLDPSTLAGLLDRALELKRHPNRYLRALYERTLLMIFEAPSLRTRLSFETAMTQLHGHAINYYTLHSPWGAGKESIEDLARTVSRYCDAVTARLYDHGDLVRLARAAGVPVVNAMTDEDHPCQILADLLTIREYLGHAHDLRVAYVGDARNNVTYGWLRAAALTRSEITVACPAAEAYRPEARVLDEVRGACARNGGAVRVVHDPREAVAGAGVIYTDSWMSYRVAKEEEAERVAALTPFRVDEALMAAAPPGALFMHCLPAWRGHEVSAGVIDGPRSIVFDQAENRLHAQKALLLDLLGSAGGDDVRPPGGGRPGCQPRT